GFYRRGKRDGQTVFDVLDLDSLEYRPAAKPDLPIVAAARDRDDLGDRLRFLLAKADEDRGARYLRDTLLPSLAYAARRVPEIADSLVEVDHAVEWGFGYQLGPFRAWDAIGVADGVAAMEALGLEAPPWGGWGGAGPPAPRPPPAPASSPPRRPGRRSRSRPTRRPSTWRPARPTG